MRASGLSQRTLNVTAGSSFRPSNQSTDVQRHRHCPQGLPQGGLSAADASPPMQICIMSPFKAELGGTQLAVVGSWQGWEVSSAVLLERSHALLSLPSSTTSFDFKLVAINAKRELVNWEPGPDRHIDLPPESSTQGQGSIPRLLIRCTWGVSEMDQVTNEAGAIPCQVGYPSRALGAILET